MMNQAMANNSIVHLSVREREVLDQISFGLTTKEIASNLYLSDHTIITHRKNLLIKMSVRNTAGLIRRAFEVGYLRLS